MNKKIVSSSAIIFVLSLSFVVSVQASSATWIKAYGGTCYDYATSMVKTPDGGYALAGTIDSLGEDSGDFWLVKTDASGNMEWNQTYGGTEIDNAHSLVATSDGGYALAGRGNGDFWLVKTDPYGNMEWNKTYKTPQFDWAHTVVETADDGYAIAGYKMLVKTDELGNMEWNKTYENTIYTVIEASGGGYLLAGGNLLVKTYENGSIEWTRTYGEAQIQSLVETPDQGYTLVGYTNYFGAGVGSPDFCLIKTDATGNQEWNQTYEGPDLDCPTSLIITSDGGYIMTGHTNSSGGGANDSWLVKTDALGNMQWKKTLGGEDTDRAFSVVEAEDGRYVIAGDTLSFGAGCSDFWLAKTEGCAVTQEFVTYEFDFSYGYELYVVTVETNSTLGGFDFGVNQNQISFSVTGPTGTTGFCRITIPEDISGDNCPIYLNDEELVDGVNYTKTYNGTHTILEISYSHSTHLLEIIGTNVVPEHTSWILPTLLISATLLLAVYKKKQFNKR